jgi:hypothetical protein
MTKSNRKEGRRISAASGEPSQAPVEVRDLEHYDALTVFRDRCLGLRCAIGGAHIAEMEDQDGLMRLATDLIEGLNALCSAFAEERGIKARGS